LTDFVNAFFDRTLDMTLTLRLHYWVSFRNTDCIRYQ